MKFMLYLSRINIPLILLLVLCHVRVWSQRSGTSNLPIKVYWCSSSQELKELELVSNSVRCKGQARCNVTLSPNAELLVYNALGGSIRTELQRKFNVLNLTQPSIYPLKILIIDDRNISNISDVNLYRSMGVITSDNKVKTHAYQAVNSGTVVAFGNEYYRTTSMQELDSELDQVLFNVATPSRSETQQLAHAFVSPLQGVMRLAYYNPTSSWGSLLQTSVRNFIPQYDSLSDAAKQALQMEFEAAKKAFTTIGLTANSNKVLEHTEHAVGVLSTERMTIFKATLKAVQIYFNYEFANYMAGNNSSIPTSTFLTSNNFTQNWCSLEDDKILEAIAVHLTMDGRIPITDARCSSHLSQSGIRFNNQPDPNNNQFRELISSSVFQIQKDLELLFQKAEEVYRVNRGAISPDLASFERKALWYQIFGVYMQKHNSRFL